MKIEYWTRKDFIAKQPKESVPLVKPLLDSVDKDFIQAEPEGSLKLKFTISTGDVDRDGDVISVDGWDYTNFAKGGSVLWSHDPTLHPVAKPKSVFIEDGKLKSVAEFTPADLNPFGYATYQLVKQGFIKGTSVGFKPSEWTFPDDRDGVNFYKQQLLEYSITPVPANPYALHEAKSVGIDVEPLKQWSEQALDEHSILVPKALLEEIYSQTKHEKLYVFLGEPMPTPNEAKIETKSEETPAAVSAVEPEAPATEAIAAPASQDDEAESFLTAEEFLALEDDCEIEIVEEDEA